MAWKVSHLLFSFLWVSLLLLLLHEFHNFKFKINSKQATPSPLITRKLVAAKFDFTPFQKHHQHYKQDKVHYYYSPQTKKHSDPAGDDTEIDPRYGVQKRLVPTGPNPLHH
ncbi:hypothetical protein CCACVL1_07477 [Corchorus capsularis]|uniref:Uncharacterized protein n=1 Tax=Corchorus capsularis TaxID=210143 RepID=A0A1R3J5P7_COCAP|nr:hypothetical protein CCACVL1_07477 [Corchorus capsularis]